VPPVSGSPSISKANLLAVGVCLASSLCDGLRCCTGLTMSGLWGSGSDLFIANEDGILIAAFLRDRELRWVREKRCDPRVAGAIGAITIAFES
jgi:hypothetical protein